MSTVRSEDAKTRILDAAEELMARQGYAGTSVSQLCSACGLSASAIYWHFESKEGVMVAVLERGITRYLEVLEAANATTPAAAESALRAFFEAIEQRPEALRLAIILGMEDGANGSVGGARVAFVRQKGRRLLRSLAAALVGLPEAHPDMERLGAFLISALDGAVILQRLDDIPLTQAMSPIFDLFSYYRKG